MFLLFGSYSEDLEKLKRDSINFIRQEAIPGNPYYVGFSGGKDSIVLAKLMDLANVEYHLRFSLTTLDPPEIIKFIKKNYPQCKIIRSPVTFWKALKDSRWGGIPPSLHRRWCCRILKEHDTIVNALGIRKEESKKRSRYKKIDFHPRNKKRKFYYPILDWPEWAVWDFIEMYQLIYPALYNEGFHRIGCVICPYHSYIRHKLCRKRWPRFYARFEREIIKLFYARVESGRQLYYNSPEEFLHAWYRNSTAFWYAGKGSKKIGRLF